MEDPIRITRTSYKVSDFLTWQRSGGLDLSPSFQRRPVWQQDAKSYLLDTVVRGLPIPIIFIREKRDLRTLETRREIVDGQQRLRTLFSFIDPKCLKDYQEKRDAFLVEEYHNEEIAGKSFEALTDDVKERILEYEFSVQILPVSTDDKQVLQIFARLNSSGVKLKDQELRNAKYVGRCKNLMYTLAYEQLEQWRSWKIFGENQIARMDEVELTSELAMLIMTGTQGKKQSEIDRFYEEHERVFSEEAEIARRFRWTMGIIDDLLGADLRSLVFRRKTLFYDLFSLVYDLGFGLESPLKRIGPKAMPAGFVNSVMNAENRLRDEAVPEAVAKALRGATDHASSRKTRLRFLKGICAHGKTK